MKISPTIGRVLWYYPRGQAQVDAGDQPHAASVAYVHSDERINIGYLTGNGESHNATSVFLKQEGAEPMPGEGFCIWMPYQQKVAARDAAAESTVEHQSV